MKKAEKGGRLRKMERRGVGVRDEAGRRGGRDGVD